MDDERHPRSAGTTRRRVLGHGVKLAYVVPLILASARAEPVFAGASGGNQNGQGNNQGNGNHH